jgi:hypothetical protein
LNFDRNVPDIWPLQNRIGKVHDVRVDVLAVGGYFADDLERNQAIAVNIKIFMK